VQVGAYSWVIGQATHILSHTNIPSYHRYTLIPHHLRRTFSNNNNSTLHSFLVLDRYHGLLQWYELFTQSDSDREIHTATRHYYWGRDGDVTKPACFLLVSTQTTYLYTYGELRLHSKTILNLLQQRFCAKLILEPE